MSLEAWKSLFEWGGIILLFLTFVFGGGALIVSTKINRIQAGELREFRVKIEGEQQKTAEAQSQAAKAQLALKQYVDLVAKSSNPRLIVDPGRFIEILKGKPKGTADIWFEPNDPEARDFAENLARMLGASGAGWNVSESGPLPPDSATTTRPDRRTELESLRLAASTGLAIGSNSILFDPKGETLRGALINAIDFGTGGWNISGVRGHWEQAYPSIPDRHFVIVVGHHRVNVPLVEFTPPKQ